MWQLPQRESFTYNAGRVEETVLYQSFGEAEIVTARMARVAIADGAEYPREINSSTAT